MITATRDCCRSLLKDLDLVELVLLLLTTAQRDISSVFIDFHVELSYCWAEFVDEAERYGEAQPVSTVQIPPAAAPRGQEGRAHISLQSLRLPEGQQLED